MKPNLIILTLIVSVIAYVAYAQTSSTSTGTTAASGSAAPAAAPAQVTVPANPMPGDVPIVVPDGSAPAAAPAAPAAPAPGVSAAPAAPVAAPAATAAPVVVRPAQVPLASDTAPAPKTEIRMNFQGTPLADVLNYLSTAAGFVIVQQTPVTGTVNIIARQPVSPDEAVTMLDAVLAAKGYAVIRNGRILNIMPRSGAQTSSEMPVTKEYEPDNIPKVAEMETNIIAVKYVDSTKLIENLRPLLAADASITVNEGSNAIIITDTKANIHRMAEIVKALDTSVSSISKVKVYPLRYADAKDFATVLTQLFSPDDSGGGRNGQNGGPGAFFRQFVRGGGGGGGGGGFGGAGGGGGEEAAGGGESEARKAATRVIAVADEQSNSVVVSAPDEYIPLIDDIVARLDTSTTDVTVTRLFELKYADATTSANILNQLYGDSTTMSGAANNRNGQNNRGGQGGNRGGQPQPAAGGATTPSERQLQQARMVAVPDPRTNSILVNCSPDTMSEVEKTVAQLDATDVRTQHVHTISLAHADPDTVVSILRTVYGDNVSTTGTNSALTTRSVNGASSDILSTINTNSGGTGGR